MSYDLVAPIQNWPGISFLVRQRKGVNLRWSQDYKAAVGTGAASNMPVFPVLLWPRPISMTIQILSNSASLWFHQVSKLLPRYEAAILLGDTLLLQAPKLPISVLEMKCNVLKELVFVPKSQQGVSYSPWGLAGGSYLSKNQYTTLKYVSWE